ncbi:DUF418 domain-containing protein [Bacillus sp. FJAT-28004]|uniref:DUF418 domain-containing protein n=1 Tax=Bacillus sp. FJAT-28004 TaxID=1679165 RepID=UPI000B272D5A|nr:DUF418 domain-containing protein [Bacillus sp. FJAT-28004]
MNPISVNTRIETLDYLRGFALIGILLVNILPLLNVAPAEAGTANWYMSRLLDLMVESRFYVIFTFLFGVGFYLFLSRAIEKGNNGYILFIRRLIFLLVIGFVHQKFHPGEALFLYAIAGFILLPFYKLNAKINLIIALATIIPAAFLGGKLLLILPLFLLGLAAGQYKVFQRLTESKSAIRKLHLIAFVVAAIGFYIQLRLIPEQIFMVIEEGSSSSEIIAMQIYQGTAEFVGLLIALFYVTTLVRAVQHSFMRTLLKPLSAYGQMALTNYLGQTVIVLLAGKFFNLNGMLGPIQTTLLCIGIYFIQMLFSMIWLSFFRMGPMEWIWRIATYWTIPTIRNIHFCKQTDKHF